MAIKALYCLTWTESEAGWGQRIDGYTYCVDKTSAARAKKEGETGDRDNYWRASEPKLVEVDEKTYREVNKSKNKYMWYQQQQHK